MTFIQVIQVIISRILVVKNTRFICALTHPMEMVQHQGMTTQKLTLTKFMSFSILTNMRPLRLSVAAI